MADLQSLSWLYACTWASPADAGADARGPRCETQVAELTSDHREATGKLTIAPVWPPRAPQHNHVADIPEASFRRVAGAPGGFDTHVQHVRLTAGTDTGWHTHPGPAVVSVVKGQLRYEDACRRATYGPGTGFVDAGFGYVHHAIAGSDRAEFYVPYLLPHGAPQHFIPAERETRCHDDDDD